MRAVLVYEPRRVVPSFGRAPGEVRIELDGVTLAASSRAKLLFEGAILPTRAYLPRDDVLVELTPSELRTQCAYKGETRYWNVGEHENLAWTYDQPLRSAPTSRA